MPNEISLIEYITDNHKSQSNETDDLSLIYPVFLKSILKRKSNFEEDEDGVEQGDGLKYGCRWSNI
jgi:hypothetical protein